MNLKLLKIVRVFHLISKESYNEKRQTEIVKNSPLFDAQWYLKQNPDVKVKKKDAAEHYVKYGWKEGRNPGPKFDANRYWGRNDDAAKNRINPLVHYEMYVKDEAAASLKYSPALFCARLIKRFRRVKSVRTVLLISHELTYTGAPLSLLQIAKLLKDMGYRVITVSQRDGGLKKEFRQLGKVFISHNINKTLLIASFADMAVANTLLTYVEYSAVRKLLPTAWMIREPHGYLEQNEAMKKIFNEAENLYCMSDYSRTEFLKYNQDIRVIKHGITDYFEKFSASDLQQVKFAVIGTIDFRKGQDILINAIKLLNDKVRKNSVFYIVGKCCDNNFEKMLQAANLKNVKMLNAFSNFGDMIQFYKKISCVVVPSREEPTSRVAIEAMMMGVPVILSSCVGAQYLLNGKNGFMFENENSEQLAEILQNIIQNPAQLVEMQKEARRAYLEHNEISVFRENLGKMIADTVSCCQKK